MRFITDAELAQRYLRRLSLSVEKQQILDQSMIAAAMDGEHDEMNACLKQGADPNARHKLGKHVLTLTGYKGCVISLLDARSDPEMAIDGGMEGLIAYCLDMNRIFVAEGLRDYHVNYLNGSITEELDDLVNNSIHEAEWARLVNKGKREITTLSLLTREQPKPKNGGQFVRRTDPPKNQQEILDYFLIKAVNAGYRRELEKLLREGANPNVCDADGNSALKLSNFVGCTITLLASGADATTAMTGGADELIRHHLGLENVLVAKIIVEFCAKQASNPISQTVAGEMQDAVSLFNDYQRESGRNYWDGMKPRLQKLDG